MNVTTAQAREAVYQRFKASWDVTQPTVPYFFENERASEPTSGAQPWARVTLRHTDDAQHTLGAPGQRIFRREANVWVQLFGPLSVGMGGLDALAQSARLAFEGEGFGGVDPAGAGRLVEVGSDGKWYEVAIVCPVTYYETR